MLLSLSVTDSSLWMSGAVWKYYCNPSKLPKIAQEMVSEICIVSRGASSSVLSLPCAFLLSLDAWSPQTGCSTGSAIYTVLCAACAEQEEDGKWNWTLSEMKNAHPCSGVSPNQMFFIFSFDVKRQPLGSNRPWAQQTNSDTNGWLVGWLAGEAIRNAKENQVAAYRAAGSNGHLVIALN